MGVNGEREGARCMRVCRAQSKVYDFRERETKNTKEHGRSISGNPKIDAHSQNTPRGWRWWEVKVKRLEEAE